MHKPLQRQLIPEHHSVAELSPRTMPQRIRAQVMAWRRKAATLALVGLTASVAAYAVFGHDGLMAYRQKKHQAEQLHQQILTLQKENERMALHDQRLQNDSNTIEYEARKRMHYTRPGEVIYTLPEPPKIAPRK